MLAERQFKPSYTAILFKAASLAVAATPYANRIVVRRYGFFDQLFQFDQIDGAISTEVNLSEYPMAANLEIFRAVDQMSIRQIHERLLVARDAPDGVTTGFKQFQELLERIPSMLLPIIISSVVYSSRLWQRHRGGAFMMSSPSKYGVDLLHAHWPFPLVFSFGKIGEKPMVFGGELVVRRAAYLSLVVDRRLMAGAQGAKLFREFTSLVDRADALTNHV
ncbi:MAG: 2-oxo acid dehydrogenase subunit E2 [Casimicrobium sp.]